MYDTALCGDVGTGGRDLREAFVRVLTLMQMAIGDISPMGRSMEV
jgi:hypothetical protein